MSRSPSFQIAERFQTDSQATIITLRDSTAPTRYVFHVELPVGSELLSDGAGGYDVVDTTGPAVTTIGHLDAPWARDAAGVALHTEFSLRGHTLVQSIDTHGATFPVQADPHYTWGWITGTIYFNKSETRTFASMGSAAAFIASLSGPWNIFLRALVAYLWTYAGLAVAQGKCLKVKSTLQVGVYSGGYCR